MFNQISPHKSSLTRRQLRLMTAKVKTQKMKRKCVCELAQQGYYYKE